MFLSVRKSPVGTTALLWHARALKRHRVARRARQIGSGLVDRARRSSRMRFSAIAAPGSASAGTSDQDHAAGKPAAAQQRPGEHIPQEPGIISPAAAASGRNAPLTGSCKSIAADGDSLPTSATAAPGDQAGLDRRAYPFAAFRIGQPGCITDQQHRHPGLRRECPYRRYA